MSSKKSSSLTRGFLIAPWLGGSSLIGLGEVGVTHFWIGLDPDSLRCSAVQVGLRKELSDNELALWEKENIRSLLSAVDNSLSSKVDITPLRLEVSATLFQDRVWRALRETKPGETLSYQGLAERIGYPSATRAVARACAANNHAIIIPCHRVVLASSKQGGGYRWGKEMKEWLIKKEATLSSSGHLRF